MLRWLPARQDVDEVLPPTIKPYFAAVNEALARAEPRPSTPQWVLIEQCLDNAFQQLVTQGKSLDSLQEHQEFLKNVPAIFERHVVQPGETLEEIARRSDASADLCQDTSLDLLAAANGMTSRSGVRPEQILLVPVK